MPKIQISSRRFTHTLGKSRMDAALSTVAHSGRIVGTTTGPPAMIRSVSQTFLRNGTMESTEHLATHALARNIMSMMGCTPLSQTVYNNSNYSLLTDQTDEELVDNPNKIDENYFRTLTPGTINISDVFKDTDGPIFNIDTDLPLNLQVQNKKEATLLEKGKADYVRVAAKTLALNLSLDTTHKVRAFRII